MNGSFSVNFHHDIGTSSEMTVMVPSAHSHGQRLAGGKAAGSTAIKSAIIRYSFATFPVLVSLTCFLRNQP